MLNYANFRKEVSQEREKLKEFETITLTEEFSVILQKKFPQKLKDPRSSIIPCIIGESTINNALCDLEASINLMLISLFKKLGLGVVKQTIISLQLVDRSITYQCGIIEDILVNVDKIIF